ncbi:probable sensor/response regulator hybrid [Erythrobacter sp. NAP1]|uniref:sensor histidine kinase n=1 Tax=Erythrobacter sp. NAP1 TaxID=237727 RepID=UPI0000686D5C|nr:HAMP domain-containing sensor histidine kinase [Erythrobacter sp. NAP1]EAQ29585.1 probable sensor/response regulator hybrid [Erythrobacter sp. NAP1]
MKSLSARAFSVLLPVALGFFGISTWIAYDGARTSEVASSRQALAQDRILAQQSLQLRFDAIERAHKSARQRTLSLLESEAAPSVAFDQYFPAAGDGTRRSADSLWDGQRLAIGSVRGFGAFISDETLEPERRRVLSAAFASLANFVDGLPVNVSNIYFFSPDNDLIMFAPTRSDQLAFYRRDAPADLDFQEEEFSQIVRPQLNPEGEMQCTSLRPILYDETEQTWTTGCMTPVRTGSGQIGAFGSSLLLDEIFAEDEMVANGGIKRAIVTRQGKLIRHPDFTVQSSALTGQFLDLTQTDDPQLRALWEALSDNRALGFSGYLEGADLFIDAASLEQPEWFVISFIPGETIRSNAFAASRPILITGLLGTALFAIFIIIFIRRILTNPVERLAARADGIAAMQQDDGSLSAHEGDELARLNTAFDALEKRVAQERLRLTRSFDQLVDAIEEYAILLLDPVGNVVRANSAAKDGFDWAERAPLAQIMGGDEAAAHDLLERVSDTGRVSQAVQRARGDGSTFWAFEALEPMMDQDDVLVGFAYVARDMTGQKEAEAAIIAARDEASAELAARTNILAVMSHEIRTPLGGLVGIIEQLKNERSETERTRALSLIEDSCEALLDTLDAILQQARLSQGAEQREAKKFRPSAVAQRVAELFRPLARRKAIRIELISSDESEAVGDPGRVQQVLANLVSNSVKFTQSGSVNIEVQPPATSQTDWVFIVSDTGVGIDEKRIEKVFDPFDTSGEDSLGKSQGTGLGLSITRDIIEAMNGEISVESEAGRGAKFTIRLPLGAVEEAIEEPVDGKGRGTLYVAFEKATEQIQAEATASGKGWMIAQTGSEAQSPIGDVGKILILTDPQSLSAIPDEWLSVCHKIIVAGDSEVTATALSQYDAKLVRSSAGNLAKDLPDLLERALDEQA